MQISFSSIVEKVETERQLIALQAAKPAADRVSYENRAPNEPTPYQLAEHGGAATCGSLAWCDAMRHVATGLENHVDRARIDIEGPIWIMIDALETQLRDLGQLFHIFTEMLATGADNKRHTPPNRISSFDPTLHWSLDRMLDQHTTALTGALEAYNGTLDIIENMRTPAYFGEVAKANQVLTLEDLSTIVTAWIADGCAGPGVAERAVQFMATGKV